MAIINVRVISLIVNEHGVSVETIEETHQEEGGQTRIKVRKVTSLLQMDGSWGNCPYYLPTTLLSLNPEEMFESPHRYYSENNLTPPQFEEERLSREWDSVPSLRYPSSFLRRKWADRVNKACKIGGDYSWRAAAPHERLYSRPSGGYVALPLAHFKAGLTAKPHRFLVALFRQQFKCSIAQFSPNTIWLILWFIAACKEQGRQPTFLAFFTLFYVKRSRIALFFELFQCKRDTPIGSATDGFKPVLLPKSQKHWNFEFLMLRGGDWAYMPGFAKNCEPPCVITRPNLNQLVVDSLAGLLCTFKEPMSVSDFYRPADLKRLGRKCLCLYHVF